MSFLLLEIFPQLNALVDDSGKAVQCDFGLSRVRVDITIRTTKEDPEIIVGSRNWMAPELLEGGSLKKVCDTYAYGMTIPEVSFAFPTPSASDLRCYKIYMNDTISTTSTFSIWLSIRVSGRSIRMRMRHLS